MDKKRSSPSRGIHQEHASSDELLHEDIEHINYSKFLDSNRHGEVILFAVTRFMVLKIFKRNPSSHVHRTCRTLCKLSQPKGSQALSSSLLFTYL